MECNRDEADRAKSIAESKLEKRDYTGARKFALKAQGLYPGMDGIPQLLKTIDVYICAEIKVCGEIDWYGVLDVSPSSDEETIRKQYRKLALALHPDKNKSAGADGAFKLISQAWKLLSDKAARLAYNQKRGNKGFHQKVHVHPRAPSTAPTTNGVFNFANTTTSILKPPTMKPAVNPTRKPPQQRTDTFWTICHKCKMHYEYLKVYLNQTLLCPSCRGPFKATETLSPHSRPRSPNRVPRQQEQNRNPTDNVGQNAYTVGRNVTTAQKSVPGQAGSQSFRFSATAKQQDPVSRDTNVGRDPFIATKAANVVQQAQDKHKRTHIESFPPAGSETGIKKQKLDDESCQSETKGHVSQGIGGFVASNGTASGSRFHSYNGSFCQPNSVRDLTIVESRNMLMAKGLSEVQNKLKTLSESIHKVSGKEKGDQNGKSNSSAIDTEKRAAIGQTNYAFDNPSKEDSSVRGTDVPDADFHDFDLDRTEDSFGDNEVWAGYDDADGMPRFYALVSKVISRNPFKLRISWLNSKWRGEFGVTLNWTQSSFYKTCGEFRVSRYENSTSINEFSHKVDFMKNANGGIFIYPKRGDVWALYKNWSSDWDEKTPDDIIRKYEMVTVIEDYKPDKGTTVTLLEKVDGFRTVFRPKMEQEMIKRIPMEEMFRFSHRVPHHLLTGAEDPNAPKGFLELDTAATPMELLQVTSDVSDKPITCPGC